ncbi:glutamine-hydrolyzing carbamoyl-phosphate synthase small subunit [Helicobacter sp. MIT 21-1697]|uniref:glutamine-hydrolyzing carbamoyl-phosphate synthase small subunit n=1 Tax=Helicobacter sp. MIT 21-1697 TaxID=2993733 RepID=UPI00224AA5B5|nr:glutamine-hydrolyzing carbamoyl-phosphate synthase small subunit [Helicobacter sp. MIT 21-1697]MCX2716911.1 glutamine-hydrolyzing carbamoyl-phosphate synthase small subunit [Helicobacter sp. MIT 21-1697]
MSILKEVYLYFANGLFFKAQSFGSEGTFVGEVVFNTSMSGYQEVITDPSYTGQFIVLSMPEIGIVGANNQDRESSRAACTGVIVSSYNDFTSNFRSEQSLSAYLKEHNIMGICGVDTRGLIKMLTIQGAMMMIASTELTQECELKAHLEHTPPIQDIHFIKEISTKASYAHTDSIFDFAHFDYGTPPHFRAKVIAIDFGAKRNILNELIAVGLEVEVMPHNFSAADILSRFKAGEIQGVFLSNGPGDPLVLHNEIEQIKQLIQSDVPVFGICLGHQLLSIAHGYPTYKLKFGHHGSNHPIKNLQSGAVEITAQNHNYCVPESIAQIATITHRNLFDGTIEGVRYKDKPIFSVQHHPEASPGPREARMLFEEFAKLCCARK